MTDLTGIIIEASPEHLLLDVDGERIPIDMPFRTDTYSSLLGDYLAGATARYECDDGNASLTIYAPKVFAMMISERRA